MDWHISDIETESIENTDFRRVLFTGKHSQLVLMSLKPGEEIGSEVHPDNDQFFRVESGIGTVVVDGEEQPIGDGTAIVVPAGAEHNVINESDDEDLKLYTIYSPAHHPKGTVHHTKKEAEAAEEKK
ncbi:MAG TPA: cupin domain-containing protein [Verrucomicrobiae bacterium]|nr:cupin domain-containing protein [Verrucomicrobiae bacterium]